MKLEIFHPAVARWFARSFPAPTDPQLRAWPEIKKQRHTLIAAPTGSGKTLAAFLSAIDDLVRLGVEGKLDDSTHVIYVSPLKALSNDVQRNLQVPLEGIQEELKALELPEVNIRTLVRTGGTPADERGSHLALWIERLEQLVRQHSSNDSHLTRIGLSATQRPIEEVARFLVGT